MDIRKVLYATDLSPCARQAFAPATSIARRYDAELHVFHAVVLYGQEPYDPMFYSPAPEEAFTAAAAVAEKDLAALAESSSAAGARVVIAQRSAFRPAAAVLAYAESEGMDMIVLGTHGRSGAARALLGSVAEEVMRYASCPVLVMRALEDGKNRPVPLLRHVVVPVDLSLPAREALLTAGDVARRYGARLTLLHVIEERTWVESYPDRASAEAARAAAPGGRVTARAERRLRKAAAALPPGVPFEIELRTGDPAAEIVAFADRTGADMVVMESRGLTGLHRLMLGSTTEQVVRTVDAPVIVVHPRAPQAAEVLDGRTMESLTAGG